MPFALRTRTPLLPAALAFVSFGFVLVRVRVRVRVRNRFAMQTTPHQDQGRARAAGNRFARDDKVPGPQLGAKQLPGERPRESAET